MCRHLAWLGVPRAISEPVLDAPFSLAIQASAPRRQRNGRVNADGFGVAWWDPVRPEPARYRRTVPIWTDASLRSFAPVVRAGCILASVRNASDGMPYEESATAPFVLGAVALSHNGTVDVRAARQLLDGVEPESRCDSALLAAAVAARLAGGAGLAAAVADVVRSAAALDDTARLNLLAADGSRVVATAWGDTLSVHTTDNGVLVASEPVDDDPGWRDVPDYSIVEVSGQQVTVAAL